MSASEQNNLSEIIEEQLPGDIFHFIQRAGDVANSLQQRIYLVGGVVRDLLLERINLDIDLVVEGDAIKLAQVINSEGRAQLITHPRFGTAKLKWGHRSVDFVTARAESYSRPGALPTINPGTINDDLKRRDFAINAMAVELNPRHFGILIDPFDGCGDLNRQHIRVLHEKSFVDDATRIWRALRYEQRLDFTIEPATRLLLKRDIVYLKTISGDRIRHELELVLREEQPEKALCRAFELGVLTTLHPALKGDSWLVEAFEAARVRCLPDLPHPDFYLALLCYRLTPNYLEQLIQYLRPAKTTKQVLQDTMAIKEKTKELKSRRLAPSEVYEILNGFHPIAYAVNAIAGASAADYIELYLNVLRNVKPALTGEALKKLGVKQGPRMKEVLAKLRHARLDGKITTKKQEEEWVKHHSS